MPDIKDTDGDYYGNILAQLKVNDKTAMGLFVYCQTLIGSCGFAIML